MIHKEVHRLGTHQYNMLFIVCFISRIIPTANKSLPVFLTNNFLSFSFFCFHFSPVFMCVPHEPWPNTSLQFCPFTMWVSGVSNSGHLAWWQAPLLTDPSHQPSNSKFLLAWRSQEREALPVYSLKQGLQVGLTGWALSSVNGAAHSAVVLCGNQHEVHHPRLWNTRFT